MPNRLEQVSPNADNYMRGGTRVYVRKTSDSGFINLGNIVTSQLQRNQDVKEHVTGYDGTRVVDRRFIDIKSIDYTVKTDENTFKNIDMWLAGGDITESTRAAGTGTVSFPTIFGLTAPVSAGDISGILNKWFELGSGIHGLDTNSFAYAGSSATPLEEGVDYLLDKVAGMICLLATISPTTDFDTGGVFYTKLALDKQEFDKVAFTELDVIARGWNVYEGGQVRDRWAVPKARLEPSGNADVSIENPRELEFKLIQLKDSLLAWGTLERYQAAD